MSAQSDSQTVSSPVSCSQPAPLLAILAASNSSSQLESVLAANASLSANIPDHSSALPNGFHEFPYLEQSPQQSTPLETLSILRI
jgi:hypothetical protein